MKYRIKQINEVFYPQYKSFWFWQNIGYTYFAETIFNKFDKFNSEQPFVYNLCDAKVIIVDFIRYNSRVYRAGGDCICSKCGKKYYDHQMDKENLDMDGNKFLHVLCNGDRVKL